MNMFVLDYDPQIAASYYVDAHVVKIPLELAQVVSTVFWNNNIPAPYRSTHKNHPLTLWAGASLGNMESLISHAYYLGEEYTRRYGKVHKSIGVITELDQNLTIDFPQEELTPFALCMPDEYKIGNAVESYRAYYKGAKRHLAKWKTKVPEWWE